MKKIISFLSILTINTSVSLSVVACHEKKQPTPIAAKSDLKTITQLTGLTLLANSSQKFEALDIKIVTEADQFKNKWPLFGKVGFQIKYYISKDNNNDIAKKTQKSGNFWIVIKVASCDIYWQGETDKLKITLN